MDILAPEVMTQDLKEESLAFIFLTSDQFATKKKKKKLTVKSESQCWYISTMSQVSIYVFLFSHKRSS